MAWKASFQFFLRADQWFPSSLSLDSSFPRTSQNNLPSSRRRVEVLPTQRETIIFENNVTDSNHATGFKGKQCALSKEAKDNYLRQQVGSVRSTRFNFRMVLIRCTAGFIFEGQNAWVLQDLWMDRANKLSSHNHFHFEAKVGQSHLPLIWSHCNRDRA